MCHNQANQSSTFQSTVWLKSKQRVGGGGGAFQSSCCLAASQWAHLQFNEVSFSASLAIGRSWCATGLWTLTNLLETLLEVVQLSISSLLSVSSTVLATQLVFISGLHVRTPPHF